MRMTGLPPFARTGVWLGLACGVAAGLTAAGRQMPASQAPATPQQPTFRAAANFVQVDVYPTAGGRPVADLSKNDFEVLEDGVPQQVATFEHVSVHPSEGIETAAEPRSVAASNALVADLHNRLFVLFLDTYHVTDPTSPHTMSLPVPGRRPAAKKPLGPSSIDQAIVSFLERAIGTTDLVAPMSPELDARQMVFTRRPERFADWVSTIWGRRFSWDDLDPEEDRWGMCYPPDEAGDLWGCYRGIFEEMVLRRREKLTLEALEATVDRLGQLREGRKAVLLITEGWQLFRPNEDLARAVPRVSTRGCPPEAPEPPRVFVGPGGRLQTGTDSRDPTSVDRHECDATRFSLAHLDDERDYRHLLDRANRENVSFYPVDPRGLAVFDTPIDAASPGPPKAFSLASDQAQLRRRLEALRNLATATDGFLTETNDLTAGMKKIADDLSEYYLLGYNSTNGNLDGKFRKITVRVKRPGVDVRARRGYLAATEAEMRAAGATPTPPEPGVQVREAALGALGTAALDRTIKLAAGYEWTGVGSPAAAAGLWAVAELGESAARRPEWQEGGDALLTVTSADGHVVATQRATISPDARVLAWRSAGEHLDPGDYVVRVTARPTAAGEGDAGEQMHVGLPEQTNAAARQPGTPRVFRRGPSTGRAYVQTADMQFRRVERLRVAVSLGREAAGLSARVLDRRGQTLGVPVDIEAHEADGQRVAVAEAALAPLAPGDYLVALTVGEGGSNQTVMIAFRIVP